MSIRPSDFIRKDSKWAEFARFCIVGVTATLIDASFFFVANHYVSYKMALVCSYFISLTFNYILTVQWTFKRKFSTRNAFGVVSAHLFNLFIVRWGLMYLFVSLLNYNDYASYMLTLSVSTISNFVIVRYIVNKIQ